MKTEYRRDYFHSYLVLSEGREIPEESYDVHMITENRIEGFLSCKTESLNGGLLFYYDVTSKQALKKYLELNAINSDLLDLMMRAILAAVNAMREYLLPEDGLLLDPETIFVDAEVREMAFCYYPGAEESWEEQLQKLGEFVLTKLDHGDRQAVVMGYAFYQKCMQREISAPAFNDLLKEPEVCYQADRRNGNGEAGNPAADGQETGENPLNSALFAESEKEKKSEKKTGFLTWLTQPIGGRKEDRPPKEKKQKSRKARKKKKEPYTKPEREEWTEEDIAEEIRPYMPDSDQETGTAGNASENAFAVREERKAFREDSEETVFLGGGHGDPATGYAHQGERARLVLERGESGLYSGNEGQEESFLLTGDHYVIGKNRAACDLILLSPAVSRVHAILQWKGNCYALSDLNSRNGTKVNDRYLVGEEEAELQDGDRIVLADQILRYEDLRKGSPVIAGA